MTADVREDDLALIKSETLGTYQFGRKVERHHFCTRCGTYTHHHRSVEGIEWGVNVGALEGVNPRDVDPVQWMDGVNWNPGEAQDAVS